MTDQDRVEYFANQVFLLRRQLVYHKGRRAPLSKPAQLAAYARYRASDKGRARTQRYNGSEAKRQADARYRATEAPYMAALRARIGAGPARLQALRDEVRAIDEAILAEMEAEQ